MCIVFLHLNGKNFDFIIADNRDEDVDRPTGKLSIENGILCCKDQEKVKENSLFFFSNE